MVLTADATELDPELIRAPTAPDGPRSAIVRLRNPYIPMADTLVTVALYLGTPPVLVDGCVIEEIAWSWGASSDAGVLTVADAGGGTITLYDPGRRFDPANYDNATRVGTRVQIVVAGVTAFTGRVDDLHHDLTTATIAVVDDVSALAAVQFVETSVPAEVSSARISRILDLAAWPAGSRDIGGGGVQLQAGTVASDAWSELVEVTRNELGALWLRPDGVLTWRNRAAAWAGGAPAMVFGCPPSDTALTDLGTRGDQSQLVNVLSAARRTGTQATVTDSGSITAYGRHSHVQNDLEVATDGDRDLWSSFYLTRQASPVRGVAGFAARPGSSTIAKALALPFGTIVQVVDSGHGPDLNRAARWIGARWQLTPTAVDLSAVVGEDASIRQVDRARTIDTPADWQGTAPFGTIVNTAYREPGLAIATIPAGL